MIKTTPLSIINRFAWYSSRPEASSQIPFQANVSNHPHPGSKAPLCLKCFQSFKKINLILVKKYKIHHFSFLKLGFIADQIQNRLVFIVHWILQKLVMSHQTMWINIDDLYQIHQHPFDFFFFQGVALISIIKTKQRPSFFDARAFR